jgi:Protein kinase domain/Caspase domain
VGLPDPERSRAVLIGTSKYADDKLPDLPVVSRTVGDLAAALTDPEYGVIPEENCAVLVDEGDIRLLGRQLRSAARQAEDLLLVFYAGHGLVGGRRHDLYLGLPDSEWAEPEFNSLEYDKLRSAVLDSAAATKIIVIDCCFSGRVVSDTLADPVTEMMGQIDVDGTYVLASAQRDQVALILPGEQHTAFTGRLLRLFHEGVPNGPELLTIDDFYLHILVKMKAEGLPQPQKRGTGTAAMLALTLNRAFSAWSGEVPSVLPALPVSIRPAAQTVAWSETATKPIGILGDRYELDGVRARGGISDVFTAHDRRLDRVVAVKVLRADLAADDFYMARLRTEARAAATLDHPAIVGIYDIGEDDINGSTVHYIVMQYVEGQSLREVLRDHIRLPFRDALALVDGFLVALAVIHRHGQIYRDLTPRNIMLTPTGEVKIFNLGFVPAVPPTGIVQIGSTMYISPEGARAEGLDPRSDIYCTGCLLYELLTGQPPFIADSPVALAYQHVRNDPVPPSAVNPEIPLWCDIIVLKALAKDPGQRYQGAIEMRYGIHAALNRHRVGT